MPMFEALKALVFRIMKVPPRPEPPMGAPGSVRVFRAARGYLYYRLAGWVFQQASVLVGLIIGLTSLRTAVPPDDLAGRMIWFFEILAVVGFVGQLPLTLLMVVLDYQNRWYMVTDRSLRIREGINRVQERTMTFSNIQNLKINQGPLQRLLDIADLEVRSAGGGDSSPGKAGAKGQAESMHVGYFRGVDNANEIRQLISESQKKIGATGLGDPDDPVESSDTEPSIAGGPEPAVLAAARELLDEARRLRSAAGGATASAG